MALPTFITDPATGRRAAVDDGAEENGLVVATRPLKTLVHAITPFANDTFGADLNVDFTSSGTEEVVYKENVGTPGEWATSAVVGTWDFDSTTQAQSGSTSVDGTGTVNNDVAQFTREVDVTASSFVSLSGFIYITGWSVVGTKQVTVQAYDTGGATLLGSAVDIGGLVDTGTLNAWQGFTIPFADLGVEASSFDAIRVTTIDIGGGPAPDYFLDTMVLNATGGNGVQTFTVKPVDGTWLHVDNLTFGFADAYTGITAVAGATENAMSPNLPYDSLLGVSALTNGIVFQWVGDDEELITLTFKKMMDILMLPDSEVAAVGSDGTNTWFQATVKFHHPLILRSEDEDQLTITVSDDLSGLAFFRVSAGGGTEQRLGA